MCHTNRVYSFLEFYLVYDINQFQMDKIKSHPIFSFAPDLQYVTIG